MCDLSSCGFLWIIGWMFDFALTWILTDWPFSGCKWKCEGPLILCSPARLLEQKIGPGPQTSPLSPGQADSMCTAPAQFHVRILCSLIHLPIALKTLPEGLVSSPICWNLSQTCCPRTLILSHLNAFGKQGSQTPFLATNVLGFKSSWYEGSDWLSQKWWMLKWQFVLHEHEGIMILIL